MKLSELIADAERTLKEDGDLPVVVRDPGCGCCAGGSYEEGGTSVEKGTSEIWTGGEYVKVSAVYVVS
ncbi:hypothetical protein [Streptomyces scabiei]|uniref:hypothetical protein n=1 Tax=Streptomyces scabiei TaxID=1930 RepID=UPI0037B13A39